MRINYGISRTVREHHKKKRIEQRNFHILVEFGPEEFKTRIDEIKERIEGIIKKEYPGWVLSGFCIAGGN